jgi:hypothetical protein
MQLKQINCEYSQIEDRLLVRINTTDNQEYKIWFSRLITKTILGGTRHLSKIQLEKIAPKETAEAIAEFKYEAAKETTKLDQPFEQPTTTIFPFGNEPVVAHNVTITATQSGMEYKLEFNNNHSMTFNLDESGMQSLNLLLEEFSKRANWWNGYEFTQESKIQSTQPTSGTKLFH